VGNDDQVVRDKAIESLQKVGRLLDSESVRDVFLPMVKRLRKGDLFSMRIAASHLYAEIYPKLNKV
jgi:serine/threonine-protein phosphatase 2A regulatory subunit A